jgi:hypothetical protein
MRGPFGAQRVSDAIPVWRRRSVPGETRADHRHGGMNWWPGHRYTETVGRDAGCLGPHGVVIGDGCQTRCAQRAAFMNDPQALDHKKRALAARRLRAAVEDNGKLTGRTIERGTSTGAIADACDAGDAALPPGITTRCWSGGGSLTDDYPDAILSPNEFGTVAATETACGLSLARSRPNGSRAGICMSRCWPFNEKRHNQNARRVVSEFVAPSLKNDRGWDASGEIYSWA